MSLRGSSVRAIPAGILALLLSLPAGCSGAGGSSPPADTSRDDAGGPPGSDAPTDDTGTDTCPGDCAAAVCDDDGTCEAAQGETADTCPGDCAAAVCDDDGTCEAAQGETADTCPGDCAAAVCDDDGTCEAAQGETADTCPGDCAAGSGTWSCRGIRECSHACCSDGDTACTDACMATGSTAAQTATTNLDACLGANCSTPCSSTDPADWAACITCTEDHCAAQAAACDWHPVGTGTCGELETCIGNCPPDSEISSAAHCTESGVLYQCIDGCMQSSSSAAVAANTAIRDCIAVNCASECAYDEPECATCYQDKCSAELAACWN